MLESVFSSDLEPVMETARRLSDALQRLITDSGISVSKAADILLDYLVKNVQAKVWDSRPRMCFLVFMATSKVARNMKLLGNLTQLSTITDEEKRIVASQEILIHRPLDLMSMIWRTAPR
jgi:hypothetical protein